MANVLAIALLIVSSVSPVVSNDVSRRLALVPRSRTSQHQTTFLKDKRNSGVEATVDIQVNGWEASATVEFYPEFATSSDTSGAASTFSVDTGSSSASVSAALNSTVASTETDASWTTSETTFSTTMAETILLVSQVVPTQSNTDSSSSSETLPSESFTGESGSASLSVPLETSRAATGGVQSLTTPNSGSILTVTVTDTITTESPTSLGSATTSAPAFLNGTGCPNIWPMGNWTSPWVNLTASPAWPCANWTTSNLTSGTSNSTLASAGTGVISSASLSPAAPSSTAILQNLHLSSADRSVASILGTLVLCVAITIF